MPTRPSSAIGLNTKMLFPGLNSMPSSPRPIGVWKACPLYEKTRKLLNLRSLYQARKARLGSTGMIIAAMLRGFRISLQATNMGRARSPIQTVKIESERNWITAAAVTPITRAAHCHSFRQRKMAQTKMQYAECNRRFAEELRRRLQSHREEPEGRCGQNRHKSSPSQLASYGEDNDAGHCSDQRVDQGHEQHLVTKEFGQRIERNDKDADADPVRRVGRAEVIVIVECANRIEREVVREVGADGDHRLCVICHKLMPADRNIHKKETAENTTRDQLIKPGTALRRTPRPSVKTPLGLQSQSPHTPRIAPEFEALRDRETSNKWLTSDDELMRKVKQMGRIPK